MDEPIYETTHQMGDIPCIAIILLLAFFPFLGVLIIGIAVYVFYVSVTEDGYSVVLVFTCLSPIVIIGLNCIFLGWAFIQSGLSKFRFQADGIYVIRPLSRNHLIPWNQFREICVCYGTFTTRGSSAAVTVICCVKHGEEKNASGHWKTDNPFRYNSVITILYSQEAYERIKDMCPFAVVDLRNTTADKLK